MNFSDTSNLTGLIEDITFHTGVDTNAYTLKDRARNINQWYQRTIMDVLQAINYEQWRDTNVAAGTDNSWTTATDGTAVRDITSGTRSYQLPTTNKPWFIFKVALKLNNSDWYEAKPFHIATIQNEPDDASIDNNVNKTEPFYRIVGDQIILYPNPDTNVTGGIKIWYVAQPDIFISTDTTQEPSINPAFRRILSLGASYDWASVKEVKKAQPMRAEIELLRSELRSYYANLIDENFSMSALITRYE